VSLQVLCALLCGGTGREGRGYCWRKTCIRFDLGRRTPLPGEVRICVPGITDGSSRGRQAHPLWWAGHPARHQWGM